MTKTRSQTGNNTIKKEEEPTLGATSVTMTTRSKITKKKPSIINNRPLPAQQVKVEEDTDTKSLLKSSSKSSKGVSKPKISQEQINQLVRYIVNDNMSVNKASRKVNISQCSGHIYYNLYKNDPEKKIPLPQYQTSTMYTQEQIGNLIKYIDTDRMTVKEASVKANIRYKSGVHYYNRYLKDPNHSIPIPQFHQIYTQDQKNKFIDYVINDKMSIAAASKKAKLSDATGRDYYRKYFKQHNPDIATPSHIVTPRCFTQEQINQLISYIVDDKMNVRAASRKANMEQSTAAKYYRQYLKDNNMKIPVKRVMKHYTQDNVNELIRYIVDDKMSIAAASKKANITNTTSRKYYHQYLKDHNIDGPIQKHITQEDIEEFIGYIFHDKMTIRAASKKANMHETTGYKCYGQYLKDHNIDRSIRKYPIQDKIDKFIAYVVHDKLSIMAASTKVNVSFSSGYAYYRKYLKNKKRDVPARRPQVVPAPKNE
jgi:transposase